MHVTLSQCLCISSQTDLFLSQSTNQNDETKRRPNYGQNAPCSVKTLGLFRVQRVAQGHYNMQPKPADRNHTELTIFKLHEPCLPFFSDLLSGTWSPSVCATALMNASSGASHKTVCLPRFFARYNCFSNCPYRQAETFLASERAAAHWKPGTPT